MGVAHEKRRSKKTMATSTNLTPEQAAVVAHRHGPAVVVAGAGTGKTHTICERVASLIESGTPPEEIMMLTFTNAAADEMCERIAARVGAEKARLICAGTFHAIAARMLRTYGWHHEFTDEDGAKQVVTTHDFRILSALDNVDNIALLREQYEDERANIKLADIEFPHAARLAEIISDYENRGVETVEEVMRFAKYQKHRNKTVIAHIKAFMVYYDEYKRANNLMSFDDLISEWTTLVGERPQTCSMVSQVIVDEAQDMNGRQYDLLNAIAENLDPQNVMLVGDSAQSIYGWRGSDVRLFDNFAKDYNAKVYKLSHNFRSQPDILGVANTVLVGADIAQKTRLVAGRKDLAAKRLAVTCETRTPLYESDTPRIVLDEISSKRKAETLAVLARSASELRVIEKELISRSIPYEMHGGQKFNELTCVRDTMSMLQMAFHEQSVSAAECARVMKNYDQIGAKTASKIARLGFPGCLRRNGFEKSRSLRAQAVREMCRDISLAKINVMNEPWPDSVRAASDWYLAMYAKQRKLAIAHDRSRRSSKELEEELKEQLSFSSDSLDMLCEIAARESSLSAFCDRMALESPNATDEPTQVTLSTIHSAKGLEWDRVILLNVVGEVFPGMPHETESDLVHAEREEQRRCLYVAVTRAREKLVMCAPQRMMLRGNPTATTPCAYL